MNDLAANSLQIIRAKHFVPVLGHYCRFGFYHPGPAFVYVYAASEALFHDALHLVPTPFNAQLERALKSDLIQPKLLSFEGQAWAETVGAALYLQRAGVDWYVADYAPSIPLLFGRDRAIPDKETAGRLPNASVWRIVSTESSVNILAKEPGLIVLPLAKDIDLVIRPSP